MADDRADHSPDALFQILAARGFRDEDILDKMLGFLKRWGLKMAYHVEAGAKNYRGETAPPEGLHGEMPFQAWATPGCMYATAANGHLIVGPPGAVDGYPAEATRYEILNWAVVDELVAEIVAELSGPSPRAQASVLLKDWLFDEVGRRTKAGDIPDKISEFSEQLLRASAAAKEAGRVKRAYGSSKSIEARLHENKLWAPSRRP
jgi:hypothetical protein